LSDLFGIAAHGLIYTGFSANFLTHALGEANRDSLGANAYPTTPKCGESHIPMRVDEARPALSSTTFYAQGFLKRLDLLLVFL